MERTSSNRSRRAVPRLEPLEDRRVLANSITSALDLPAGANAYFAGDNFLAMGIAHNTIAGGLAGFPSGINNADFVILSTGDATKAYAPRPSNYPHYGQDLGAHGAAGDFQRFTVEIPATPGVSHISFDFDFMTDEVPGLNNIYDDAFSVLATPFGAGSPETLVQMHVNDDLFLPTPPANAIYQRHTGLYTAVYKIPVGATSVLLDFAIADRPASYPGYPGYPGSDGDGTGDTAVIVDNFRLTTVKQTIWLNFESGTVTNIPAYGAITTIPEFKPEDIRSSADRTTLINSIFANVAAMYADFNIDFVLTKPTSGDYGTVAIGGTGLNAVRLTNASDPRLRNEFFTDDTTISDVKTKQNSNPFPYGEAQEDWGNQSQKDNAYVLSGYYGTDLTFENEGPDTLQKRLEITIAHEIAHTLGAPHVKEEFRTNIMSEKSPRNPDATFEEIDRALPKPARDNRTSLNIYDYLTGVLGTASGSSVVNGAAISSFRRALKIAMQNPLFNVRMGITSGSGADSTTGDDTAVHWVDFNQLKAGENEIELPFLGPDTRITFYGSTVPDGPADFFSGTPSSGNMSFADGFVPLFNPLTGNLNTTLPAAAGSLGNLSPLANGVAVELSPFATPGLMLVNAKTGFTFQDSDGDKVLVKLTSKSGTAAIQLDDPDGDGRGSIARLELQGTTAKDSLTVTVTQNKLTGGDGFVDLGAVFGSALGKFTAKNADLTGAGLNFGGLVGSITVHDVENGADILTGGNFATKTTITAHEVFDGTTIRVDGQLSLTAARIGDGAIQAAALTALAVKGDAKNKVNGLVVPIPGDFKSDVAIVPGKVLTAKEAKMNLLGTVTITGRTQGAQFIVPGHAGAFKTGTFEQSSLLLGFTPTSVADPFAGGVFIGTFKLTSFGANGFKGFTGSTFDASNLIAAQLGAITLANVKTDNLGLAFGVAAQSGLAKNLTAVVLKSPLFSANLKAPFPQSTGDFVVKLI